MLLTVLKSPGLPVLLSIAFLSCQSVFSQQLPKAVDLYSQAWRETSSERRMDIIASFWTDESIYEDPGDYAKGFAALNEVIDKFWKNFPGTTFEMGPVLSTGNSHTWEWRMLDSKNNLLLKGIDHAKTNDQHQILHLTGFWYPQ